MTEIMRFEGLKDPRISCNLYNGIIDELKIESYGDNGTMITNYQAFINENNEWILPSEGVLYDIIINIRNDTLAQKEIDKDE